MNSAVDKGLPPVTPPSGKFIAQLFVVPAIIVTCAVGCIWFVTWLVGGFFAPDQFLRDLKSGNAEVRWRRASDLAQVLKRDEELAANAGFALDIAELLQQALRENEQSEREFVQRQQSKAVGATADSPKELRDERAFIEFLVPCLGNFIVPVGVPLLNEIALKEQGGDTGETALRRQLAVWALANTAELTRKYDQLPPDKKEQIETTLEQEAATATPARREWARQTLDALKARATGRKLAMGVAETLALCAQSSDPILRKFVALALTFWEGTAAENARMETTLLALSKDDGHGAKDNASLRGREIRYQAAVALARRGSDHAAARLPLIEEMLDEDALAKVFRTRMQDGREVADGATIASTMTGALRAVAELHRKKPGVDLSPLTATLDKLSHSKNPVLRNEAERTKLVLNRN